jgi:hypothetical protein
MMAAVRDTLAAVATFTLIASCRLHLIESRPARIPTRLSTPSLGAFAPYTA